MYRAFFVCCCMFFVTCCAPSVKTAEPSTTVPSPIVQVEPSVPEGAVPYGYYQYCKDFPEALACKESK